MSALHKFGWFGPDDVVSLKFRLNSLMMSQSCDPCQLWGHHTTPGWALLLLPGTALGQGQQNTSVAPGSPHANSCCWNVTDVIFFCSQLAPTTAPPAHLVPSPAPGTSPTHQSVPVWEPIPATCPRDLGAAPNTARAACLSQWDIPIPAFPSPSHTGITSTSAASKTFEPEPDRVIGVICYSGTQSNAHSSTRVFGTLLTSVAISGLPCSQAG